MTAPPPGERNPRTRWQRFKDWWGYFSLVDFMAGYGLGSFLLDILGVDHD